MNNRISRGTLEQLHRELKKTQSEEKHVQERIDSLTRDVSRVLDQAEEETHEHHKTLKQNLEDAIRHFEASYPELTSIMNNVVTSLANMGI